LKICGIALLCLFYVLKKWPQRGSNSAVRLFRHPIPDAMWQELKAEGLLAEEAPVPDNQEKSQ